MNVHTSLSRARLSLAVLALAGLGGCADLTLDQVVDVLTRRPPAGTQGTPAAAPSAPPPTTAGVPTPSPASTPTPSSTPTSPPAPITTAMDDLLGTWMNTDANTRGMTKLVITKVDNQIVGLRGYGKCSPSDCDWGAITTSLSQPWTVGMYQFGFKETRISFRRTGDQLQVQMNDHYTDRSGRQDRSEQYTFARTPDRKIRPQILMTPRVFSPK